MTENTKNKHMEILIYIAYIVIGYYIASKWLPEIIVLIMPFILAYFVAFITQPLERFFENKLKIPKKVAAISAWAVALVLFFSAVGFVVTRLIMEVVNFAKSAPDIVQQFTDMASRILTMLQNKLPDEFIIWLGNLFIVMGDKIRDAVTSFATSVETWKNVATGVTDAAKLLPGILLFWLVFIVASFFICKDFAFIKRSIILQFPISIRGKVSQIKGFATDAVGKYLRAMGIMLSIVFGIALTGLLILQVKYAFWIALMLAVMDVLPLIGTGIVLVPWGLITIFVLGNTPIGVGLIVLYVVILVVRNLVEPKVVSSSLGLYPIITLLAMYVGLKTYGFTGIILFPILALVLVYLQRAGVFTFWKER